MRKAHLFWLFVGLLCAIYFGVMLQGARDANNSINNQAIHLAQ